MVQHLQLADFDLKSGPRGTKQSFTLKTDIGLESMLEFPVLRIHGAREGKTLLILASVHGDEFEGVETVLKLYRDLQPEQLAGTVIMLPLANPLAFAGESRTSPEDGINMARVFPGKSDGSPTERIAYYLHNQFIAEADFLLDLHSGGTHYSVSTLVGYYENEQTEIGRRSRAAAEIFGAELLWAHAEIAPGRSVSSALALGVPWLYTEAWGGKRIRWEDGELYYQGSIRLMQHLGIMAVDPQTGDAQPRAITRIYGDGNFDGSETAGHDGFFISEVQLGERLSSGQHIGSIYSLNGIELDQVRASRAGTIVMLKGTPTVRAGDPLYLIAELE